MTDHERAYRLFVGSNPVPDVNSLRRDLAQAPAFLAAIEQRSRLMQTQDIPIIQQPEPPRSPRHRWLVPTLAGAATVIIAIVVGVALLGGNDEPDVTNDGPQPSPTETTTDVTVAPEVAVVMSSYEAMNNGDIDGYLALFTEEAAVERREFLQVLVNMNQQSALAEPCRLIEPTPAGEATVSCTATLSDDFHGPGGVTATVTETFVVTDAGKISLRFEPGVNIDPSSYEFNLAFMEWLMVAYPEVHADIAPLEAGRLPGAGELNDEPDDMLVALEYVEEFVAQSDVYPINP